MIMESDIELLLRAYRKAMRTNDGSAAVSALRKLSEMDKSRDWTPDLVSAERALQRRLLATFKESRTEGRSGESEATARELVDTAWREAPSGGDMDEVRNYVAELDARQNAAEGEKHLDVLRKCQTEDWNRERAFSAVKEIDRLTEAGWSVPSADKALVDECRRRIEEELAAEEKERKWRELCESLHGAVQREEVSAIRKVLSAPEFLDREPPPELISSAQLVVCHAEEAKRRKMLVVAGMSICVLLAAVGMSGLWLKHRRFEERCVTEAARLAEMEKEPFAIERMGKVLRALETERPDLFGDPRVNVFCDRWHALVQKNAARTNEIAAAILALKEMQAGGWTNGEETVNGKLNRIKELLTEEDTDFSAEWRLARKSWNEHVVAAEKAMRDDGTVAAEKIIAAAQSLSARLAGEIVDASEGDGRAGTCRRAIGAWRARYAAALPDIDARMAAAEKRMAEAAQMQKHLHEAITRLNNAETGEDIVGARTVLVENYAGYRAVGDLKPLPVAVNEIRAVLDGESAPQKAFADMFKTGVDRDTFGTFLAENVRVVADITTLYSLYGLLNKANGTYMAAAKGKPKVNNNAIKIITGELLDFGKCEMTKELRMTLPFDLELLPSTDELRGVVDFVERPGVTATQFENKLLSLVEKHLAAGHSKKFVDNYDKNAGSTALYEGYYPACRRLQMLDIYFRWLCDDMKLIPDAPELQEWKRKVSDLATPVKVDGVQDDLSWLCRWEQRVRRWDSACARLLAQIPQTWTSTFKAVRSDCATLRKSVGKWQVRTAGVVRFEPGLAGSGEARPDVSRGVFASVPCDHPLYVLRNEKNATVLKRVIEPQDGRWKATESSSQICLPGEPLFHVVADGQPIDPETQIDALTNKLKTDTARRILAKAPLFPSERGS